MDGQHSVQAALTAGGWASVPFRFSAWSLAGTLTAAALSVSLTQILLGATWVVFFVELLWGGRDTARRAMAGRKGVLVAGGLLFAWMLLSLLAHLITQPDARAIFRLAARRELSDLPLYLSAWIAFIVSSEQRNRRIVTGGVLALVVIVVASGVASMFSEYRLARRAMGFGTTPSARNRPQHLAFVWENVRIFRPVGFMNTRLTFAGLLLLCLPVLAFATWKWAGWRRLAGTVATALGLVVLFVNGTRSAWLGLPAAVVLTLPALMGHPRVPRTSLVRAGFVGACVSLLALGFVWAHPEARHTAAGLVRGEFLRYTDTERSVLWSSSFELAWSNPLFGVGPGAFPSAQGEWRERFTTEHPMTFYWVDNAPDGHAHNDFLHVAAVAGFPAAFFLLLIAYFCFSAAVDARRPAAARALLLGCVALLPAGLFQCYFQDDEVVVVIWLFLGLAAGYEVGKSRS